MLNTFFSNCWNHAEPPLSEVYVPESVQDESCPDHLLCTTDKIIELVKNLDIAKANGPDGVSACMLKATVYSIAPSLTSLFNLSISKGHFPKMWKTASVVPIPKSKAKHSPSGYRPISLLSILSKLLEKHFHSVLSNHLAEHQPLSDIQWGFQRGKSTTTALLSITQEWARLLDQNHEICCVFFDLQKAFDTVPHRSLLKRLEQLHLHPLILRWIHSYLSHREQSVVVNGTSSNPTHVISGVPQGSILGPLLFLIYVDSISSLNLSEGTKLALYADDMLLHRTIYSTADYAELQKDIDNIYQWSVANHLSFNVSKCKSMVITRKRNSNPSTMSLNHIPLEMVYQYKYLGVTLSSDLSWSAHIKEICAKGRKLLGLLYRQFSNNTDPNVLAKLYVALVRPHLEYGAQVWNPHSAKDVDNLEKIQKFALRICSKNFHANYQDLLQFFQLPSLQNRRLYLSLCSFYKIINNIEYFPAHCLPSPSLLPFLRCNHNHQFNIPYARTNLLKYSFLPTILSVWNNLPIVAVNCTSLLQFKHHISPLFT